MPRKLKADTQGLVRRKLLAHQKTESLEKILLKRAGLDASIQIVKAAEVLVEKANALTLSDKDAALDKALKYAFEVLAEIIGSFPPAHELRAKLYVQMYEEFIALIPQFNDHPITVLPTLDLALVPPPVKKFLAQVARIDKKQLDLLLIDNPTFKHFRQVKNLMTAKQADDKKNPSELDYKEAYQKLRQIDQHLSKLTTHQYKSELKDAVECQTLSHKRREEKINVDVENGKQKLREKDYKAAIVHFEKSVNKKNITPEVYVSLGKAHYQLEAYEAAAKYYAKAEGLAEPRTRIEQEIWIGQGDIARVQQNMHESKIKYSMAICVQPDDIDYYLRVHALIKTDGSAKDDTFIVPDYGAVRDLIRKAHRRNKTTHYPLPALFEVNQPAMGLINMTHGIRSLARGDFPTAKQKLTDAIGNLNNDPMVYTLLCIANLLENNIDIAIENIGHAIRNSGTIYVMAHYLRGIAYTKQEKFVEAYNDFLQIDINRDAIDYPALGDDRKQEIHDFLIRYSPDHNAEQSNACFKMAEQKIAESDYDAAIDYATRALYWNENNAQARLVRALANRQAGYIGQAKQDYDVLIDAKFTPARVLCHAREQRAMLYTRLGLEDLAKNDQQEHRKIDSKLKEESEKQNEIRLKKAAREASEQAEKEQKIAAQLAARQAESERLTLKIARENKDKHDKKVQQQQKAALRSQQNTNLPTTAPDEAPKLNYQTLRAEDRAARDLALKEKDKKAQQRKLDERQKLKDEKQRRLAMQQQVVESPAVVYSAPAAPLAVAVKTEHKTTLPSPTPSPAMTLSAPPNVWAEKIRENKRKITIPTEARDILRKLMGAGFIAYGFGGYVRDSLLGLAANDFDIVTNATAEQINQLFAEYNIFRAENGTFKIFIGNLLIDINCREEMNTSQRKHAYTCDQTINACYVDDEGYVDSPLDPAFYDIDNRCVRIIVDPEKQYDEVKRLQEDPVRVLGIIKSSNKPGFKLSEENVKLIQQTKHLLSECKPAILNTQIRKLFLHGHAEENFVKLHEQGILTQLFPCLARNLARDYEWIRYEMKSADTRYRRFVQEKMNNTKASDAETIPPSLAYLYILFIISAASPTRDNEVNYFSRLRDENPLFKASFSPYISINKFVSLVMDSKKSIELSLSTAHAMRTMTSLGNLSGNPLVTGTAALPAQLNQRSVSVLGIYY